MAPPNRTYTLVLVAGMLITGTANTILNKYQDNQCVRNCDDPDIDNHYSFRQPLWQTLNMFIGEFSCIAVYIYARYFQHEEDDSIDEFLGVNANDQLDDGNSPKPSTLDPENPIFLNNPDPTEPLSGYKILYMWIPTLFDICGTTIMNVGLIYTPASVYQMLRGSIVLFVGLFSVLFLRRKLFLYQWVSLLSIVFGVGLVGASSIFRHSAPPGIQEMASQALTTINENKGSAIGVFMVLIAQLFSASQFVSEERILSQYHLYPADGVWLEGLFGMITVGLAMPILHFTYGTSHPGGYFDLYQGWQDISGHPPVWISGIFIALSIAFFNFFGLSVTRTISATSRSTIDTSRTFFIWLVSLFLGWETFSFLQVAGFSLLVYGTFLFNGVVSPPSFLAVPRTVDERSPLIQ